MLPAQLRHVNLQTLTTVIEDVELPAESFTFGAGSTQATIHRVDIAIR